MQTTETATLNENQCWDAVVQKDFHTDGQFFFAVKTTGVYCRPSCPSRTPKRSNVSFFQTTIAARVAGFRACLRCAPDGLSKRQQQTQAILQACRVIEHQTERISLNELATTVGLSPHHFHRLFKDVTGVTPHDYFKARQIAQIGASIKNRSSVTEAIYDAGFSSSGRFYENTNAMLGMTPKAYKAKGAGEHIRASVKQSALGLVLVAATDKGICTIEFGPDAQQLLQLLRDRFKNAVIVEQDAQFDSWLTSILSHLALPKKALDLPLDIRGTAFQQQVWNALQEIPLGSTFSYAQVAHRIGKPKAVRAVATACASNVIAVAIPCHRVVRGDGQLSGYRWGVERKRQLLEQEKNDH
jgi:AraC family transcriptional regulator, regulatory protein of adaptative response / methylated-DNA-[protein]-cysteine methyltransferase